MGAPIEGFRSRGGAWVSAAAMMTAFLFFVGLLCYLRRRGSGGISEAASKNCAAVGIVLLRKFKQVNWGNGKQESL